jgi:pyruvate dehydrogenase E1 component beta subunit
MQHWSRSCCLRSRQESTRGDRSADLRLDEETILTSVRKTNRLLVVEEGWPSGGPGAQIAWLVQAKAFDHLDAPIARVTSEDVPMPYAGNLEKAVLPSVEKVVAAARRLLGRPA